MKVKRWRGGEALRAGSVCEHVRVPARSQFCGHLGRPMGPADGFARVPDLVRTHRLAVRPGGPGAARRSFADSCAAHDQGRPVAALLRHGDRLAHGRHVGGVAVGPHWVCRVVAQVAVPQGNGHLVALAVVGSQHTLGRGGTHRRLREVGRTGFTGCQGEPFGAQRAPRVAALRRSIIRQTKGVKISCIANSIFPPGTTTVLARDIHESWIMLSRYGNSMPFGLAKRMTTMLSSADGISRAMNGLDVSTTGTRWKLTWVCANCGQM